MPDINDKPAKIIYVINNMEDVDKLYNLTNDMSDVKERLEIVEHRRNIDGGGWDAIYNTERQWINGGEW